MVQHRELDIEGKISVTFIMSFLPVACIKDFGC